MASPTDKDKKLDPKASLENVQDMAKKLQSSLDGNEADAKSSGSVFQIGEQTTKPAEIEQAKSSTPNPAAPMDPATPMDHAVLENIGLTSNSNIAQSTVASVATLSTANKNIAKTSILPKGMTQPEQNSESSASAIKVDTDYKPAFQSEERSRLVASMNKPKDDPNVVDSGSSLQSRLQSEQGNLYRATAGTGQASQTAPQLGGGFRMASDPNGATNQGPSGGNSTYTGAGYNQPYAEGQNMGQNIGQTPGQSSALPEPHIATHHEPVKSGGGIGAGALGMLGVLLVAGGGAAVIMKPDLLSTTGGSGTSGTTQTVSASEALIPGAMDSYQQPAAPVQNQKVAVVSRMPAPVQPAAPVVQNRAVAAVSTDRVSETGKDVPLKLDITSLKVKADQYIRIGGMPDEATLSSGVDMGDGNWLVAPDAIDTITFTSVEGYKGVLDLYMQKIKDDARTAVGAPKTFKVYIGQKPPQMAAVAPQVSAPVSQPKAVAYNPVRVEVQPAAKPQAAPAPIRQARQVPVLPKGVDDSEEVSFGALPTSNTNRYRRPSAAKRTYAPARAPRQLREAIPVGRTFSRANYGDTARPIQQERVASATPQRQVSKLSPQTARLLLKRGNNLYRLGDLISARSLYGQVAAGGDPEAAVAMGRTFDPIYFEKLGVQGFLPDSAKALEWYQKAKTAGLASAQGKIDNLNYFLNQ